MDIGLPGIDGIEALGRLRAKLATREIPVIAISAAMSGDRKRIAAAGFDAWQSEPIEVNDFVATVERLLERR